MQINSIPSSVEYADELISSQKEVFDSLTSVGTMVADVLLERCLFDVK